MTAEHPATNDPTYARVTKYIVADEPNNSGWWDAVCPLHPDTKRSAGFNFKTGRWKCFKCGSGDLDSLVDRIEAREAAGFIPGDDNVVPISSARGRRSSGSPAKDLPTLLDVEEWSDGLLDNPVRMEELHNKRGISPETLAKFKVGWHPEQRAYTIPIIDSSGSLVNIRMYRITAGSGPKIWSWGASQFDANRLFPEQVLDGEDTILITEGEWDALLAIDKGIPAVSGTTGAKQWQKRWDRRFEGKTVYICYDRDQAGDEGSTKVAEHLEGIARAIYLVELPLAWSEKNGLDITDYFHEEGRSASDFKKLMHNARIYAAPQDGQPVEVSVKESYNPDLAGQTMSMTVHVVGRSLRQYLLPQTVAYSCNQSAGKTCIGCPMNDAEGSLETKIPTNHPVVLSVMDVRDSARDEELRKYIKAHKCNRLEIKVREKMNAEMLVVRTSLDHADESDGDFATRTVVNVGEYGTDANRVVKVIGTTYPNPKDQESLFQSWRIEPVESSLDTYDITDRDIELMKVFRPARGQTPLRKIGDVARDMAANVTHIINREVLHIAMDLVWHSVTSFDFAGQTMERGWLELLVVGDARTGKSEVATKLSRHYGFGRMVSCESASIPGLLGAVKPMPGAAKQWTLEWGAIPLNDRRLVVLDEAGGLTTDQIGQLSSVRSSGIAEIVKAETQQTKARTRLIWLSNPRDNKSGMAGYTWGIWAIPPLIGSQEDIARFDLAMTVSTNDVPAELINRRQSAGHRHTYTSDACHALLRWVWSRKRDQVVWDNEAEDAVFAAALELGKSYVPDPPLIQAQNVRQKIARTAVAIAARTFSTDATHSKIVVSKEHVESAVTFINWLYSSRDFGYKAISERHFEDQRRAAESMQDVKEYMYTRPGLARFLIGTGGSFRRQQMEEMLNLSREEANLVINKLAGMNMIKSNTDFDYRIQPHLNSVLRETKE